MRLQKLQQSRTFVNFAKPIEKDVSVICSKRIAALIFCGFMTMSLMGSNLDSMALGGTGEVVIAQLAATDSPLKASEETAETTNAEPSFVTIDGTAIDRDMYERMYGGISYVSIRALSEALDSTAVVSRSGKTVTVKTSKLTLTATVGNQYVEANGRCLYVPNGVKDVSGIALMPTRTLVQAFGGAMIWNSASQTVSITTGSGAIISGSSYYDAEDLEWLSRIIYAESGNQPLTGKIAVGNVVMNRVASSLFPNTVKEVILDCRGGVYQFSPASRLKAMTPNAESIVAAKLTLEGAETVDDAMYFSTKGLSCWASRNRPYITTIANHTFYG